MKTFNVKDYKVEREKIGGNISWTPEFVDDLENIKVKILSAPSIAELRKYVPSWVMATWTKTTDELKYLSDEDADKFIYRAMSGKFIPSVLASININVLIDGTESHYGTHLYRHSRMNFAADCTGDKVLDDRPVAIPSAFIEAGVEDEYKEIMTKSMNLYTKLLNRGDVHLQDARLVLPRNITTFYYVQMNLGDAIAFIRQRIDSQIQPKTDNVVAMKLLLELCRIYPMLSTIVKLDQPNRFYIQESQTNFYSGWCKPEPQNDTFEYDDDTFIYNKTRGELLGSSVYEKILNETAGELQKYESFAKVNYKHIYEDLKDWR